MDFIFKNKILYFYIDNKLVGSQNYTSYISSEIVKLRLIRPFGSYYHADNSYMIDDIFFISEDTRLFKKYYLQNEMNPFSLYASDNNTFCYNEWH